MGKGQGRTAPGIGGPSSGCPRAGPGASHWPKQGRKMGTYEPVRAALSCGLGSHLRCPRPTREGPRPHQWLSPLSGWPAPSSPPGPQTPSPGGSRGGSSCLEVCRAQSPPPLAGTARAPPAHRRRCTPAGSPGTEVTPVGQGRPTHCPRQASEQAIPLFKALHPAVSLTPESHPGSKAQTKCHLLPTLPPLRASSAPSERPNVNSPL